MEGRQAVRARHEGKGRQAGQSKAGRQAGRAGDAAGRAGQGRQAGKVRNGKAGTQVNAEQGTQAG